MVQTRRLTVEEFERLAERPENRDKRLEYIGGDVIEVVSNSYASLVAVRMSARLQLFVEDRKLGYVTGADGGFVVANDRYIPDVGFIGKQKQPAPPRVTWIPNSPDLAVEVLSPTDDPADTRIKVVNYLRAGTSVWVVDPDKKRVEVYTPDQSADLVGLDGVLDGGDVLPGFRLAVKDIFPE
jgi:Uma2 family endonuclease